MISKKIKKKVEFTLLLIVMLQVFLLINMATANSYMIHQTDNLIEDSKVDREKNKFKDIINSGINLLIGFLSIKQIGVVSAQEDDSWCCEILKSNGATCQPISAGDDSLCDSSGQTWMTDCQSTDLCKTGTCVDKANGICSVGTKKRCEDNWDPRSINEIPECRSGCCTLENGAYKKFTRKIECTQQGGNFDDSVPQSECRIYTQEMGACILEGGNCQFVTEENCKTNLNGDFRLRSLCSNPDLGTNCEPTEQTKCYNDKVYFKDNCNNIANVYDDDKVFDGTFDGNDNYWKYVQDSGCGDGKGSATCGDCDGVTSACASSSEAGVESATHGDYACKDLSCEDEETGKKWKNTEAWCVYESYVGDSRDVVGSQHWKMFCDKGEIKHDIFCDPYRGKICAEKNIGEGENSFSTARCRFNEGWKCLQLEAVPYEYDEDKEITNQDEVNEYITECEDMSDCRIQSGGLYQPIAKEGDFSKFNICVPKYPPGLKFWESEGNAEKMCSISSMKCPTIWRKEIVFLNIKWNCILNCACLDKEFANDMNDLCISLGDCGGYVNVRGEYTKNFKTFDIDDLNKKDYYTELYGGYFYDADGDISDNGKYNQYATGTGGGDLPEFLSSAERGYFGIDSLEEFYVREAGNIDFSIVVLSAVLGVLGLGAVSGLPVLAALGITAPPLLVFIALFAIFLYLLKVIFGIGETTQVDIEFQCLPWQAPLGGGDCKTCDDDPLRPCTEYKCRSLGAGCRLIDENELYESENPVCVYKYSGDTVPPRIILEEIDENLYNVTTGSNGIEIKSKTSEDGCIQEFIPINFTLKTKDNGNDDYAKCVYNWERVTLDPATDYALEGEYFKELNFYSVTHGFEKRLPFVSSLNPQDISGNLGERKGELNMYVRCKDYANNPNFNEYVIKFCIKEGPDIDIARINEYIPESGSFLKYDETTKPLIISLDEPAECKWTSGTDKVYENMENFTSCEGYTGKIKLSWSCSTELTGLTESENNIYIKCKDQPWVSESDYEGPYTEEDRNINTNGFLYTLYATENPLNITSISPQGSVEIGGTVSEIFLEAITSGGMDNGISVCKYLFIESPSGITSGDFFSETNAKLHKQPFSPPTGNYNIAVECKDEAGNKAQGNAIFNLIRDSDFPKAVRAYKSGNSLKLITDEEASCYYGFNSCNFDFDDENINSMTTAYSTEHTANWNTGQKYYIKCRDLWGNSGCSIIVSLA